jgi:hypothetical protein
MVRSFFSIVDVYADALVDFGETPIDGPRRLFNFFWQQFYLFFMACLILSNTTTVLVKC